jgi:hypothetical protein
MPKCTHCEEAPELSIVQANEPWSDTHYYCANCDSTYNLWEFDTKIMTEPTRYDHDWIVKGSDGKILAYKEPDKDPVFIDAEAAVLKMIEVMKAVQTTQLNTSHILADLSRLI